MNRNSREPDDLTCSIKMYKGPMKEFHQPEKMKKWLLTMPKQKVTETEKRILSTLVFRECYETLKQETQLESGVLRDELITMINRGWIEVFDDSENSRKNARIHSTSRVGYDSDHIDQFSFQATKNGLRGIRHAKI